MPHLLCVIDRHELGSLLALCCLTPGQYAMCVWRNAAVPASGDPVPSSLPPCVASPCGVLLCHSRTRAGPSPSYRMAISLQLYNYNLSGLPEGVVVYRGSRYSTGKALTGFIGSWTQLDPPGSEADYTGIVPNTTRVNVKAYNCTLSKALEYLLLYPGYNYVVVQQSLRRNGSVRGQLVKTLGSP